jgi:hypothetical protein
MKRSHCVPGISQHLIYCSALRPLTHPACQIIVPVTPPAGFWFPSPRLQGSGSPHPSCRIIVPHTLPGPDSWVVVPPPPHPPSLYVGFLWSPLPWGEEVLPSHEGQPDDLATKLAPPTHHLCHTFDSFRFFLRPMRPSNRKKKEALECGIGALQHVLSESGIHFNKLAFQCTTSYKFSPNMFASLQTPLNLKSQNMKITHWPVQFPLHHDIPYHTHHTRC